MTERQAPYQVERRMANGPISALEETLAWQIQAAGLPEPERELVFAKPRRWRFDFAWKLIDAQPTLGIGPRQTVRAIALEVEGGTASGRSRHTRGAGFESDAEKYNEAALMGWMVLRVTSAMVNDGRALRLLQRAFGREVAK